ncbi:glycosyltransferase family 87 protein [Streptomyces sp. NPDC048415]|uniref:glycosyltransferase family 87 protein n=1 Tax=Streptomyces sp. NPDC048415 TaxID=3154822 RepID=UPI00342929E9
MIVESPNEVKSPTEATQFTKFPLLSLFPLLALSVAAFCTLCFVTRAPMADALVYRAEGAAVLNGADLYGFTVTEWQLPATYPPFAALLFVTAAWLPPAALKVAFVAGNVALLAVLVRLSCRLAGLPARLCALCGATALALWLEPVFQSVLFGQVNLAVACLILWDLTRPPGARGKGIALGIAAGVKLTPALFIAYLLLTRRRREAGAATAACAGTVLLGALALPAASVDFWTRRLYETDRVGKAWIVDNQSLQGLIARALGEPSPGLAWALPALAVGCAGLWLARRVTVGGGGDSPGVVGGGGDSPGAVGDGDVSPVTVGGGGVSPGAVGGGGVSPGGVSPGTADGGGVSPGGVSPGTADDRDVSPTAADHRCLSPTAARHRRVLPGTADRHRRALPGTADRHRRALPGTADRQGISPAVADRWGILTTALTALLISPISWSHHWVWCVPLIAVLYAEHGPRPAVAVVAVFTARTLWLIPHQGALDLRLPWWQQPLASPYPLLGLVLLVQLSVSASNSSASMIR